MIYVALIGLTLILVRSTICRPIQRLWPAFFRCGQCCGLWVGLVAGASGIAPLDHGRVVDAVLVGGVTSFLSLVADAVLLKLLGDPNEQERR